MNTELLFLNLRKAAPSVAFTVSRQHDDYAQWDGDGPDPLSEGFTPYVVTVTASAIHDGEITEGSDSLCGCYYGHREPIGEVHGYLPQMLDEAASELAKALPESHPAQAELVRACDYITGVMRAEYQAQQSPAQLQTKATSK